MKILFVAYCMIDNGNGDSLIGVYKRCLRVGQAMHARGHEIWISCVGRKLFRDPLVDATSAYVQDLDVPFWMFGMPPVARRRYLRSKYMEAGFDLVVLGEVPLGGSLLDAALVAAELELPVAVLDNAYGPMAARYFVRNHGPLCDAIALTGLSSFHPTGMGITYCEFPPLVTGDPNAADPLLEQLQLGGGADGRRLVTVLGYEKKATALGLNLLEAGAAEDCEFLLIVRNVEEVKARVAKLPEEKRARVQVILPQQEEVLFSILRRSQLAIGKCGFMQVSESLALGTPFLAIAYGGCFDTRVLPLAAQKFVWSTSTVEAKGDTIAAFDKLLRGDRGGLAELHDGRFDGLDRLPDFLERVRRKPESQIAREVSRIGYGHGEVLRALRAKHPGKTVKVRWVRGMRLMTELWGHHDALGVSYTSNGVRRFAALRARRYWSLLFGKKMMRMAMEKTPDERVLYRSWRDRCVLTEGKRRVGRAKVRP